MPSRRSRAPTRRTPLGAEDLHRLAWSAGLSARDEQMLATQERVYHARLQAGEALAAARAAFWLGFRLLARGEAARASGWLSRAQRLVDSTAQDCVEQGYLLLPAGQRHLSAGEARPGASSAPRAPPLIGERFAEVDLIAFARNLQGRALLAAGQIAPGLRCLDEAMVAATAGELSPVVTGIVYCSAIASCHRVFALERVREWTAALSRWCEAHPQLGPVHRALPGAPRRGHADERRVARGGRGGAARGAAAACATSSAMPPAVPTTSRRRSTACAASSHWPRAAYREASRAGFEPQPGLALLRLAQGDAQAAASASRRMVGATHEPLARTRFLPAHVEIMLAVGDLDEARAASRGAGDDRGELSTPRCCGAIAAHAARLAAPGRGRPAGRARSGAARVRASGSSSARRTSPRACACCWRAPALALGRRGRGAPGAGVRAARCSSDSGAQPDLAALAELARRLAATAGGGGARERPRTHARASCRCCGSSPPARPTRRSPASCP